MFIKYHTRGIVISGRTDGADSKRIDLFAEKFGLVSARVQGARNVRSKLRAGTQDFVWGEFSLIRGRSGWRIVSAKSDKNLFEIFRSHPEKLKIVSNILNLLKKLVSENEGGENLFEIVSNFFAFLGTAKDDEIRSAECLTLMRVLHFLGYMQSDPEYSLPILSVEIQPKHLEEIAPLRSRLVSLINESLKAA